MFSCIVEWKASVWMPFLGTMCPEMHIMLVYRLILESLWVLVDPNVYSLSRCIYIVFCHFFIFYFLFLFSLFSFLRFCGYIFCKPSRDITRPLRGAKGFKGLVAYAECNRDSYESELVVYFSFLLFCSRTSKRQVWGCVERWIYLFYVPLSPTFSSYNNLISRILPCFIYVL